MKLQTLFTTALALLVAGLLALPQPAEAKRFGGGGNVGKQYNTMPRQAQPPQQTQRATPNQAAAQRPPQASGASRWLGPLAGLAAGGLLASLFFGDAFEGFQVMDFLLIALLVFGAFMLFRMLRRGQAGPRPAAAGAFGSAAPVGAGPVQGGAPYARMPTQDLDADGCGSFETTPCDQGSGG
jgi:predicted lipid-binding transport protein (Tim44 family)